MTSPLEEEKRISVKTEMTFCVVVLTNKYDTYSNLSYDEMMIRLNSLNSESTLRIMIRRNTLDVISVDIYKDPNDIEHLDVCIRKAFTLCYPFSQECMSLVTKKCTENSTYYALMKWDNFVKLVMCICK